MIRHLRDHINAQHIVPYSVIFELYEEQLAQKEKEDRREREKTAMRLLESLTPSGSEFVGDPEYCYQYVRNKLDVLFNQVKHAMLRAKRAEKQLDEVLQYAVGPVHLKDVKEDKNKALKEEFLRGMPDAFSALSASSGVKFGPCCICKETTSKFEDFVVLPGWTEYNHYHKRCLRQVAAEV